ncbi:MAG TPA: MATE family efflux transporter [Ignavibacteriaceae bacterium]|nr:MATE family efflux transporter [Ignavibacteriaceae bacterium]
MNLLPENNFYKQILKLALPAIAGLSTQMIVSLVDAAIVGRLHDAEYTLSAMGIGVLITWALVSFFSSFSTGTQVITARRFGIKNYSECGNVLNNSMLLFFSIGIIVAAIAMYFAHDIPYIFTSNPMVAHYAGEFIFFRFIGIPFFLLSVAYRGFFFGINKTKIFMFSAIITNVLNIVFNYVLVFGKLGISPMGVAGSGLGSTLATTTDFLFYFIVTILPRYAKKYEYFKHFKIDKTIIKNIFKISLPVSFQNVFILIGFLSFMGIIGKNLGPENQAATQACISTLFLSFLPCFGFGIAVQTLVGNNLGAGKVKLAKIYGYETAKIATYYTLFLAIIYIFFPQWVLIIITNNQHIIDIATNPLRIAGFAQIFYATGVVLANGLQSGGKTLFVMLAESITNLGIFVPLVFLFVHIFNFSLVGAWAALPIYIILYAVVIFWKFRKEKWEEVF